MGQHLVPVFNLDGEVDPRHVYEILGFRSVNFTGADAKEKTTMAAKEPVGLVEEVIHIAKNLERRIVSQVLLEVTVAALHRAVAGKIDHKIVAAYLSLAAGTFLQEIPFVTHQEKSSFPFSQWIA